MDAEGFTFSDPACASTITYTNQIVYDDGNSERRLLSENTWVDGNDGVGKFVKW